MTWSQAPRSRDGFVSLALPDGSAAEGTTERDRWSAALGRQLLHRPARAQLVGGHRNARRRQQPEARERCRQLRLRMHLVRVLPVADDLLYGRLRRERRDAVEERAGL